jgi:ABC-type transport system involved in multi-copper enzyme maturation permease subunit
MSTFAAIVRWEVAYYFRRISTYVYFLVFVAISGLFMLVLGGAFGDVVAVLGSGGKVKANAPLTLAQILPLMSLLGVSITAALAGNALYRDYDAGIDPLIYTSPLSRPAFLGGRFVGSLVVNGLVLTGIAVGALLACISPWVHKELIAPFSLSAYVWPYITHIYPNLLLTAAIFFALVALTRQMLPNYIGGVVLLVGYLLSRSLTANLDNKKLAAMIDPFGIRAGQITSEYWTIAEKNERLLPMDGLLLTNRLLWIAVAGVIFAIAYFRFRFSYALPERRGTPAAPTPSAPIILDAPVRLSDLPQVRRAYGAAARRVQFMSIATRAFWRIVKNRYFVTIVVAGLLYLILGAQAAGEIYGTKTWPVTYQMVEVLTGTFGVFQLVIIALYAGELVWSERDVKIAGIYDSTPIDTPLVYLAKLAALCGVIIVLQLVLMVAGVIMQAAAGYHRFEIPVYLQSLLGIQLIDLLFIAVFAMTVHVVVDNKYLGHFLVILMVIGNGVQQYIGLEHKLWDFGSDAGATYSDMNQWGPFLRSWFWWKAYWTAFSILLVVLIHLFWVRGSETEPRWRLVLAQRRLSGKARNFAIGAVTAFVGLGAFIFYNTNILNTYRGRAATKALRISYEKQYKRWEYRPQPRITKIDVAVDLYPSTQAFAARGTYRLHNVDSVPIDTVVISLGEWLHTNKLEFSGGSTEVLSDPPHDFHLYKLSSPLAPGDSTTMTFDIALEPRGFSEAVENTSVVSNGTFLSNSTFMPGIGYEATNELSDDDERRRAKLPEKERMRPPTDPRAIRRNYVSADADFVRYSATVSTEENQTPITSGYLDSTWVASGRRYARYVLDAPVINLWAFQSASFAVKRDKWTGSNGQSVDIEIDYYPRHDFNIERMIDAVKKSLDYYTVAFGPYQHHLVRIVEFPRYASYAQSLPNTIPYSEAIGFIARLGDPKDVDYPFYVTAHEVGHQWWAHQVIGANAQGATMLSETLAQYSAMMVMERQYGHANMRRFLQYELDRYLLGRSAERKREMPIDLVENQQYIHYNKGSVVMYALRDYIGEDKVNSALRGFLNAHKFRGPPYPTALELVDSLRAVTPDTLRYLIKDLLETITLYELKTDSIVVHDTTEGRFRVDIYGSAKKVRADSLGRETDEPMNDLIEIALFKNPEKGDSTADRNGVPVYQQKHRLGAGPQKITVISAERPIRGGIDPMHKLVDRRVDDNTKGVFDRSKSRFASAAKKKTP